MDQILLYTSIGYNEKYLDIFKLFCDSLCYTTATHKNLLVITDERFSTKVQEIASKYAMLTCYIHAVPNSKSPEEASINKTKVFDFKDIFKFRICLYVDVDCLFINDVQKLFRAPVKDNKLYVYAESKKNEDHNVRFFSLKHKDNSNFYTTDDLTHYAKNKIYPFNAGLFLFKVSKNNQKSFIQLQTFINTFDGTGFYEQSFMNTYFNLNGMSDFSYFTSSIAMQTTHNIDEKFVQTTSSLTGIRQAITSDHVILHFNATLAGNAKVKYNGMKNYFDDYCLKHTYATQSFDTRSEMIQNIIPENAVIAEIGVFKGDFAHELLQTNPQQLYLVDCWMKGPMMSGDVDGNNVVNVSNAEDLYHSVMKRFKFNANVSIHKQFSNDFLASIPNNSLDVIYIDGDHSYMGVKRDLEYAIQKVRKYGCIMGHDYKMNMRKAKTSYDFGVKKAVDEFCKKYSLSLYAEANDGCVSFAIINTYEPPTVDAFQFIAISVSEQRKADLLTQFNTFYKDTPLTFIDTTRNEAYFPTDASVFDKNRMDCARNHFKALEYAARSESPEFSIILEDDVIFHKTDFVKIVHEVITNWDDLMGSDRIASIGWIPLQNYTKYESMKAVKTLEFDTKYKVFNSFYAVGMQAYIVRKSQIASFVPILVKPTYNKLLESLHSYKCSVLADINDYFNDYVLPRLLGQRCVFPPAAIESDCVSILESKNTSLWNNFFKGYSELKINFYNPNKFQFLTVSASEERRKHVRYQCSQIAANIPLYFIEPDDPPSYVPTDVLKEERKVMYCTRSHFKALERAAQPESPEFSVILEDDVAFHKTQFITAINEIIERWSEIMGNDKMASIGWIPCNNYDKYLPAKSINTLKSVPESKILNDRFVVGTQAYIVRKKEILSYINILLKPTYKEYEDAVKAQRYPNFEPGCKLIACDVVIPRILGQRILFPPVAIETQTQSIIGHPQTLYWNTFFKDHESLLEDYYATVYPQSYYTRFPELNIFKTFKQIIIWGFPLHSHTHSYIHNAWYRTFQALQIPVYWYYDANYPKDFDFNNSCFITEGWVEKNIPLLANCTYFVHIAINPKKYIDCGARLIEIRYNVESIDDYNYKYTLPEDAEQLSKDTLYQIITDDSAVAAKRGRKPESMKFEAIYMYWATDILPHEFDYNDASLTHENVVYHVGSMEKGHPLFEFPSLLSTKNIQFKHIDPWKSPVSYNDNIALMKKSYCCPDFRNMKGVDADRTGYVPCRVFKAISYGHTGITNSPRMKKILGDYVEYVDNVEEILVAVEKHKDDTEWRRSCMKYVATHHTFINRASDLARALSKNKPKLIIS
jgi:GR25 family glycosyltransferase involved in LPS biosynthesis